MPTAPSGWRLTRWTPSSLSSVRRLATCVHNSIADTRVAWCLGCFDGGGCHGSVPGIACRVVNERAIYRPAVRPRQMRSYTPRGSARVSERRPTPACQECDLLEDSRETGSTRSLGNHACRQGHRRQCRIPGSVRRFGGRVDRRRARGGNYSTVVCGKLPRSVWVLELEPLDAVADLEANLMNWALKKQRQQVARQTLANQAVDARRPDPSLGHGLRNGTRDGWARWQTF